MDQSKPSFFITTPIYYVNADPHLGTAYSTIIADVQARYRRSAGYNVKFLTGMDEHGEKVAEAAAKHNMTPQEWTDSQAPHFKELWSKLEISNDDFIRTTEPRQHHAVQYLWERMKESGYLYKGSYDGWYCVPDETYFTDTQVQKGDEEYGSVGQHLCPDCHRPLERVQEESYFFKLSAFQDKLLKLYDEHPDFVEPAFRMNEVRSFVEGGLNDLSVSRTSFDWGIQVPFDEGHVTYVWFDALLNYMTAVGYGVDTDEARAELAYRWPAQFHIVGKDIIRFHCVWQGREDVQEPRQRHRSAGRYRHAGRRGLSLLLHDRRRSRYRRRHQLRSHGAGLQRRPGQQLGQSDFAFAQHERKVL